jgi:hypothetical protein
MGPGLWFGDDRVHVRLSHTHNGVPGLAEYKGPVDPRNVRLALSRKRDVALQVQRSEYVRFVNLAIHGGGNLTVRLDKVKGVEFDHVDIFSATHGVRTSRAENTTFAHCRFLGGLPDWFFRSDAKAGTRVLPHGKGTGNGPGAQTSRALLVGAKDDTGTYIHHSEFRNGHDLYLSGSEIDFHHNWVDNLDDEALLLDAVPSRNVEVHENVITRSLSAISFAGGAQAGPHYIYRNLIDLRRPTAGNRPRHAGDARALRYGHLYKTNAADGPWELFQNTFLVSSPQPKLRASFTHLRVKGASTHRALNNVFVAARRPGAELQPILLVPAPTPATVSDGNAYFRLGGGREKLYRLLPKQFVDDLGPLQALGYERDGIDGDPGFRRLDADDFRLKQGGRAAAAGVELDDRLPDLDPWDVADSPSIGAYRADERRLRVGVDGRRLFPPID